LSPRLCLACSASVTCSLATRGKPKITRWRRWDARVRLGMPPDRSADDPALGRTDDCDRLRRALAQLPPRQRTVLALRNYEDLPDAKIAELMGCAPGTVRSQAVRRGRCGAWHAPMSVGRFSPERR